MVFQTLFKLSKWYLNKPIIFQKDYSLNWLNKEQSNNILIVSSEHAINYFEKKDLTLNCLKIFPNSLEIDYLNEKTSDIKAEWIVGIGGGRIIDSAKYLTWKLKKDGSKKIKLCLIPSITSTTSWLNMGIAVRKNNTLVMPGSIHANMIIFDPNYIITAPQSLNLGGLADLIACSSAISDWILSYEKNKERISKKGCQLFKQFIHDLIKNVDKLIPFTIESTQYIYNKFLEALALCGASLSDRPLEGAEHFLYYLIDELSPRPWNHGQIIAFTSLICLYLHKKTAFFSLNEIKSLYERIGINYRMSDLQITPDLLRKALLKINKYVIENKKHYSIWNEINFETQGDILNEVIEFAENI